MVHIIWMWFKGVYCLIAGHKWHPLGCEVFGYTKFCDRCNTLSRPKECPECDGTGDGYVYHKCFSCGTLSYPCKKCGGSGELDDEQ